MFVLLLVIGLACLGAPPVVVGWIALAGAALSFICAFILALIKIGENR